MGEQGAALLPAVLAVAFLMDQLDATVIATSLPAMAASLGTTPLRLNLAITGYVLGVTLCIPASGWIADRLAARRVFVAALLAFTAVSAACGLATSLPELVGLRTVQGVAGGLMSPVGRLILLRSVPRERLAAAMSRMAAPMLVGPALGPLIGGALTSYASWRWIFFVNIPVGLAGAAAAMRVLPRLPPEPRGAFDLRGLGLVAAGLAPLQIALELLASPRAGWPVVTALLLAGTASLLLYARRQARCPDPLLDLSLFRLAGFRIGVLAGGLCRIGLNAAPFLLPLMLQLAMGYSAIQSGLVTSLASVGAIVTKPVTQRLLRRLGFDRLLPANALLGALSVAGFAWIGPGVPVAATLALVLAFGMIRSVQFSSSNALGYADLPPPRLAAGVSLASMVQQLGMSVGVALSATLLGRLHGDGAAPPLAAFHTAFLVMALFPLVSTPAFLGLDASHGAVVSGHRRIARAGLPG